MEQHVLAYIGLGANVGEAREAMERAVSALSALPGCALAGVSRLYRTRPVGPVEQGDFLNAVVALRAPAGATPEDGAMALLVALKELERAMGRVRRERWGPREIDLDLLLFGVAEIHVERQAAARSIDSHKAGVQWLHVPHAAAAGRSFVLAPLADLAPQLVPPGWDSSVAEARARAEATEGVDAVEAVGAWDHGSGRWHDHTGPAEPHPQRQEEPMPTSPHMPPSPPELIERFGMILERFPELERRKMFGYPAAFAAAGHMVTGLHGSSWIVRLGEAEREVLRSAGGSDFEPMPGRPMKGFLSLPTDIVDDDATVAEWIGKAQAHAASLPPKRPRRSRKPKRTA